MSKKSKGYVPPKNQVQRWFNYEPKEMYRGALDAMERIYTNQMGRRRMWALFMSLYENRRILSLDGDEWMNFATRDMPEDLDSRHEENICKSIVDSAVAKIATNRPRPVFNTVNGTFEMQKQAEMLSLFCDGMIQAQRGYSKGLEVFRDGCVWDNGVFKIDSDQVAGQVVLERKPINDILVDTLDGKYRDPRSIFEHKVISRDVLRATYPDKELSMSVENAALFKTTKATYTSIDDPVSIFEAWHQRSSSTADDGVHLIYTTAGNLIEPEPWEDPLPFAVWRWKTRLFGWHGLGVIEDVIHQQTGLKWLEDKICRWLNSMTCRIAIKKGSKISYQDLTNAAGIALLEYVDEPPIEFKDQGPGQEIFMERDRMKMAAFEQCGLSMLFAQGKKPAGLSSGAAIREVKDTESERFLDVGQQWDQFWIDVADLAVRAAARVAKVDPKFTVAVGEGRQRKMLKWSDVQMNRDQYAIEIQAASLLPKETAGKMERIQELMGMFPQLGPMFARYLKNPDVDSVMSFVSAPIDAILADVEKLDNGEVVTPEPFLDLELAKGVVLSYYLKARNAEAPDAVLMAYRQYLISVSELTRTAQQTAAPQAAPWTPEQQAAGMMPQGMPPMGGGMGPGGMPPMMPGMG